MRSLDRAPPMSLANAFWSIGILLAWSSCWYATQAQSAIAPNFPGKFYHCVSFDQTNLLDEAQQTDYVVAPFFNRTRSPLRSPFFDPPSAPRPSPSDTTPAPIIATTNAPAKKPQATKKPSPSGATAAPIITATTNAPAKKPEATKQPVRPPSRPATTPRPMTSPTTSPSSTPTSIMQAYEVHVGMLLYKVAEFLSGKAMVEFETVTADFIKQSIEALRLPQPILNLLVDTNVVSQSVQSSTRLLQTATTTTTTLDSLRVVLDVQIKYRSLNNSYQPSDWVSSVLMNETDRATYLNQLRASSSPALDNVDAVQLLYSSTVPVDQPAPTNSQSHGGNSVLIIVVACVGGCGALIVLGLMYMGRPASGKKKPVTLTPEPGFSAEVLVDQKGEEISTLGDSMRTGDFMSASGKISESDLEDPLEKWSRSRSSKNRHRLSSMESAPTTGGELSTMSSLPESVQGSSVVSAEPASEQPDEVEEKDDDESDWRFEVKAPPGKLGMVIDTPHGGVPVVHTVKPESVLFDCVRVGDRLIRVDEEDVSHMKVKEVSQLITIKSDQERLLVFVRRRGRVDA